MKSVYTNASTMEAAVQRLEARGVRRIAVVRMFISSESFVEPTKYILGLRDDLLADLHARHAMPADEHAFHERSGHQHGGTILASDAPTADTHASDPHSSSSHHHMEPPRRIRTDARIFLSREGVADSALIDQILVDRVRALSTDPAHESVLILGHGPGDDGENQRWLAKMTQRAQGVRRIGAFRSVQCETLREDWPEKRADAEKRIRQFVAEGNRDGGRVIVVPFRIAGFGPYREVLEGLTYVADGRGFCPHPNMARWLEEAVERTLAAR